MSSLQRRKASRRLQRLVCKKNEFDDLPYDVVVNILSRLPITTLIRIKYTCKLWRSIIIDDPLFPELHFSLGVKNPGHVYGIQVFTLGGESWRELEHVPYPAPARHGPVYCNGVLYWSAGHSVPYFVLSFDLDTEQFQKRRVFPTGNRIVGFNYLVVLGENVSFVLDLPPDYLEVWRLMDEKKNIWVKKYHLCRTPKLSRTGFKLSGLWMNGDLYGMRTIKKKDGTIVKRLYSYNAESEKYTVIKLPFTKNRNAESILPCLVLNHVGSLISPSKIVTAEGRNLLCQ
ncbi:hypothetical protein IFM89_020330 [Coptis chinensis]|uniref:F-box domain-containing protein n=1 Tax=Coptis chinensis TaxID=261450 RepID=A0A835H455_9MAGN|nr:hypothetical protein IFM89_020330 [Coptis chinensis]